MKRILNTLIAILSLLAWTTADALPPAARPDYELNPHVTSDIRPCRDRDNALGDGTGATVAMDRWYINPADGVAYTVGTGGTRIEDPNSEGRRGILVEPVGSNILLKSRDLDDSEAEWAAAATPTCTQNETGVDGTANKAWTIEDNNNSNFEYIEQTVSVSDDAQPYCFSVYIKKTTGSSVYHGLGMNFTGGAPVDESNIIVDTNTGSIINRTGVAPSDSGIEDTGGDFWLAWIVNANNNSGNTVCTVGIVPGFTDVFDGSINASSTGSAVFDAAMLEVGSFPSSYIDNDGVSQGSELISDQVDRDFSGASDWTNNDINAYDETGDLTITADAAGQWCNIATSEVPMTTNKAYVLSFTVANLVSNWIISDADGGFQIAATVVEGTNYIYFEYTDASSGGIRITSTANDSSADFDDFSLKEHGTVRTTESGNPYWSLPGNLFAESLGAENIPDSTCATDFFDSKGTGWTHDAGNEEYDCDGSQTGNSYCYEICPAANSGSTYKLSVTYKNVAAGNARFGTDSKREIIPAANGTYTMWVVMDTNKTAYFGGDANFIGSIDDISVKEVTNAWDGMPPHGTLVMFWRPGFGESDVSTDGGILGCTGAVSSLVYHDVSGNGVGLHDGTTEATDGLAFSADTWYKIAVKWGYLSSNVAKMIIGTDTGAGISWGTAQDYDGAFTTGNLVLGQTPLGPMHIGRIGIWKRILSDGEIDAWYGSP